MSPYYYKWGCCGYFHSTVTFLYMIAGDLVTYHYVWVCLLLPFIFQVVTDKVEES
jgi:hypothetical protein